MFESRLSNFKVKKFKRELELQEILLDALSQKKEEETGISPKQLETPLSKKILLGLWISFLILIFILFGKTFQLQVLEGKTLSGLAAENEFIIRQIQAERGVIYDRNLNQLVFNKPSFDLICEGEVVSKDLDHQNLILWKTKIEKLPECEIKNNTAREYVEGSVFAHLLGYCRKTGEKTGLEEYYDEILKARPGELQIKRDVYGSPISKEIISLPESGESLVLWLDSGLQKKILQSLEATIKNVGAEGGAAVALDPNSGGVLALVSYPSFNNNLFSQGITPEEWQVLKNDPRDPFFNRVVAGTYLTGSTIKPLIASAALEEKIINPEKKIHCAGEIIIPNPWQSDTFSTKEDWTAHGWTDLRKAIAESCNVYFYTIGGGHKDQEGLGPTRIKKYLELFGWADKTGIDLSGEAAGFIPDKEWKKETFPEDPGWWDGDTYNLSIGQGFLQITPLEVAASFVAIANRGKLLQPQIVQKILDGEEFQPEIVRENFISPENLQIVREGMRQAVATPGMPSYILNFLPVPVADKTGTAELGKDYYHNWVTVFAPHEHPQIVLTVVIEKVKGMKAAALPVAKEVLEWYFSTLDKGGE